MPSRSSVIVAAVGLALLAGCSAPSSQEASSQEASSSTAVSEPVTVRLLAHDSFVVSDALIAELRDEQGIALEIVSGGDAGSMVAGAVLAAGAPTADVMFGVDSTLLSRAVEAEVFAPYESPELARVIPALRDDTAGGQVTPVDYGDVCVNIDATWFAEQDRPIPTTLADLARPEYRGLFAVPDPGTSSPGLAFLLATIATFGDDWPAYWAQLRANDVAITAGWTEAYTGLYTAGGGSERPIVVSYATSPPAEIVYAADPKPEAPRTAVMTDGCYRQVEYAGVLAGTPQEQAARSVIDWLLSEPVQADVPLSMFVFPAREGTPLPEVFTQFAAKVPAPLQLPAEEIAANLGTWLTTWGAAVGR